MCCLITSLHDLKENNVLLSKICLNEIKKTWNIFSLRWPSYVNIYYKAVKSSPLITVQIKMFNITCYIEKKVWTKAPKRVETKLLQIGWKLGYKCIYNIWYKAKYASIVLNRYPVHIKVSFLPDLNFVPVFVHAVKKKPVNMQY